LSERIVLVVDDEPTVLDQVSRMLRRGGFGVVALARPQEARVWGREHPDAARLVVSDVVMPGMTGLELIEALRKDRPDLPVLLISGYPDRVPRGVVGTVAPLLQKPFRPVELVDAVKKLLGE
jgi:DNA-binding NtrC family response regulator